VIIIIISSIAPMQNRGKREGKGKTKAKQGGSRKEMDKGYI